MVRPTILSGPTLALIVLLLLGTVLAAAPPLREIVADRVFDVRCLVDATKDIGKEYADFAVITFTLLVAFIIGGVLVTDRIAEATHAAALRYQQYRQQRLADEQKTIQDELYAVYQGIKAMGEGITIWNFPGRIVAVFAGFQQLMFMTQRIPLFLSLLLLFRFGLAFPKGFYGVLALAVFEGLLLAQVAKTYFEYLPVCPEATGQ
jgi:hypothetical protein